jgi:hypothetical protein
MPSEKIGCNENVIVVLKKVKNNKKKVITNKSKWWCTLYQKIKQEVLTND